MNELLIYRGLPGSGKTTEALAVIAARPRGSIARVNRDDLCRHAFDTTYQPNDQLFEDQVTALQHSMIRTLLRRGITVICDDTNLHTEHVIKLTWQAQDCMTPWSVYDLTNVSLELCIERDASRPPGHRVGAAVIRAMWKRHIEGQPYPLPLSEVPA